MNLKIVKYIASNELSKLAIVVQMIFVFFSCIVVQMIPFDYTFY